MNHAQTVYNLLMAVMFAAMGIVQSHQLKAIQHHEQILEIMLEQAIIK